MKKITVALIITIIAIITCLLVAPTVHAQELLDSETKSELIEIKEKSKKSIEDYNKTYGSEAYGMTAYVLNIIRIYSIPFCFLGIAISGVYQYIIGIRKLDVKEKGLTLMVTFVTTFVICQILPLAFAIVVKFGRG